MDKIEIGKVCMKGSHPSFQGEQDHGVCGRKYYATIYMVVENDWENPRGESPDLEDFAQELAELVSYGDRARDKAQWEAYDASRAGDK